jgi:hypothetical protein
MENNDYKSAAKTLLDTWGGAKALSAKVRKTRLDWVKDDEDYTAIVEILASNNLGRYLPQHICDLLNLTGCDGPDEENYWDNWYLIDAFLNDQINEMMGMEKFGWVFYLAISENDDYCLFAATRIPQTVAW